MSMSIFKLEHKTGNSNLISVKMPNPNKFLQHSTPIQKLNMETFKSNHSVPTAVSIQMEFNTLNYKTQDQFHMFKVFNLDCLAYCSSQSMCIC